MTAILCKDLSKIYSKEKHPALNSLFLEVPKNSIFGFLGPNGAGKTTTIKILTGLMLPTSGYAEVYGIPVGRGNLELRKIIGYLSQDPCMYKFMQARELLCLTGEIFGQSAKERSLRADFMLELSGLKDVAKRRISTFSGGMIQRLGIALALMGKPKVLFLDEPTSSLDPVGRKEILEFISSLSAECTVFMSSHILSDIERVSTHVAIISQGKLIIQDKTDKLKRRYASGKLEIEFSSPEQIEHFKDEFAYSNIKGKIEAREKILVFTPSLGSKERNDLLRFLAEKKFDILRYEWKSATLEDIFMELINPQTVEE